MRVSIISAAAVAAASFGGHAFAEAHSEIERLADGRCFDKGTLEFVDCPAEPVVVIAPVVEEPVEDESGFYAGLRGGLVWADETDFDYNAGPFNVTNEYEMGYTGSAFFGYSYADFVDGFVLRPELEIGYLATDIDDHLVGGAALAGPTGDASVLFGFVNLYGDIEVADRFDVILGGGAGLGNVDYDNYGVAAAPGILDDDNVAFGYHLDAGVGYEIVDDLTLEAMYRYTRFVGGDIEAIDGTASDLDFDTHQALIGLRYQFN